MCNWDFSTTRSLSLEVATYQYLSRLAGAPPAALASPGKWMWLSLALQWTLHDVANRVFGRLTLMQDGVNLLGDGHFYFLLTCQSQ